MENQTTVTTPQNDTEALKPEDQKDPQGTTAEQSQETKNENAQDKQDTGDKKEDKSEVPEKYEYKMPEGFQADEASVAKFDELAKGLGLSQEKAQKLVEFAAQWSKGQYDKLVQDWDAKRADWVKQVKEDKEFGSDKFNENAERAKRVFGKVATPELKSFLEETGFGDHPELFKMMVKIDKLIGETPFVEGEKAKSDTDLSQADRLYKK